MHFQFQCDLQLSTNIYSTSQTRQHGRHHRDKGDKNGQGVSPDLPFTGYMREGEKEADPRTPGVGQSRESQRSQMTPGAQQRHQQNRQEWRSFVTALHATGHKGQ